MSWPVDCPGMSGTVPYRRDNSDLGLWGLSWPVDCPGMSAVVLYRRDNSDLGLWGVSWQVDCPGMSGVVPYRRDNSDLGLWGGELASGLSRDVCGCPIQKGQLGPQRQSHIRLGVKDDLGISLFPGIPQRQLWHFMAILDHPEMGEGE